MKRILRPIAIAVIAMTVASVSFAAGHSSASISARQVQMAEQNYIEALRSGNDGTKISAAGNLADYRMTGSIETLIGVLKNDRSENVRISAALALVMLNEPKGRDAVEEASLFDGSDRVAKFCEALLKAHVQKNETIAEE